MSFEYITLSSMILDTFPLQGKLRNHGYVYGCIATVEKYLVARYILLGMLSFFMIWVSMAIYKTL